MDVVQLDPRFLKGVLTTLVNLDFLGIDAVSLAELEGQLIGAVPDLSSADFNVLAQVSDRL